MREVVDKLLLVKSGHNASERHLGNLRSRLGRFAADFPKHICDVTTPEIQDWLDCLGLSNLHRGLRQYFDYYNNERKHSKLDNNTPAEVFRCGASEK